MNIRPHSDECEKGAPCRRCYIRSWDKQRRDNNRKRSFVPRKDARKGDFYSAEWVEKRQLKGRLDYEERYSHKKDSILAKNKEWRKNNSCKIRHYSAKYRASKLKATPSWANLEKIAEIYARCPKGQEVDHIIPLQGENVCGLHVHYNLQYLSISDNRSKRNKLKEG